MNIFGTTFSELCDRGSLQSVFHRAPRRWAYLLLALAFSGCASVKDHHLDADRSRYYPLAVYSNTSMPELAGRLDPDKTEQTGSTTKCLVGSVIFTYGLLAPLCAPFVVFDAAAVNNNSAETVALQQAASPLLPRLEELSGQNVLRSHAMTYLTERNVDAADVDDLALPRDADARSAALAERGFPMALELSTLLLEYGKLGEYFCVSVQVQGTTLETAYNHPVGSETFRKRSCKDTNEWLEGDLLEQEVLGIYAELSRRLIDEILFRYQPIDADSIMFTALSPAPNLEIFERAQQQKEDCTPHLEDGCNRPSHELYAQLVSRKPSLLRDLRARKSGFAMEFAEVGPSPDFEWSALQGPGISDATYFLTIYEGAERVIMSTQKLSGRYPESKMIIPVKQVHKSEGTVGTSPPEPVNLESCHWYFWEVSARYRLFGQQRYTNMTSLVPYMDQQITRIPIRTGPSQENPDCWEQAVDWGPL